MFNVFVKNVDGDLVGVAMYDEIDEACAFAEGVEFVDLGFTTEIEEVAENV